MEEGVKRREVKRREEKERKEKEKEASQIITRKKVSVYIHTCKHHFTGVTKRGVNDCDSLHVSTDSHCNCKDVRPNDESVAHKSPLLSFSGVSLAVSLAELAEASSSH